MNLLITGSSGFVGKCFCEATKLSYRKVVRKSSISGSHSFKVDEINSMTDWTGGFQSG